MISNKRGKVSNEWQARENTWLAASAGKPVNGGKGEKSYFSSLQEKKKKTHKLSIHVFVLLTFPSFIGFVNKLITTMVMTVIQKRIRAKYM